MSVFTIFIGTYTQKEDHVDGKAAGTYVYTFNTETEILKRLHTVGGIINPSFCTISADKKYLYAVSETDCLKCTGSAPGAQNAGKPSGAVAAYRIDPESKDCTFINAVPSEGIFPCHVSADPSGEYIYVANYMSGSVAMFPVGKDGSIGQVSCFIQHRGNGINPERQEGPHTHSVNLDVTNSYIIAPELGTDTIMIYRINRNQGRLEPTDKNIAMTPGSGPRHFTFHPNQRFAYVINELASRVTAFQYEKESCSFTNIQEISTLPDSFSGYNISAEIRVHPKGHVLYASNRGHDSISVFMLDSESGLLDRIGTESTRGESPRHFTVTPDGRYLLAGNQDSGTVSIYAVDSETGGLEYRTQFDVPTPVCLKVY
jgi:6-phosphogluconolactonase